MLKQVQHDIFTIFPFTTQSLVGEGKGEGRNEMEFIMDREKIEKAIKEKSKDGKLPCAICFKIAEDFGISKREMGQILNEINIRISQCQLGCFE